MIRTLALILGLAALPTLAQTERPFGGVGLIVDPADRGGRGAESPADENNSVTQAPGGGPILRVTLDETTAIPGQPISVRLTILVPTFMPEPPAWPSMEAPNVRVRLPEGATGPTSGQVDGDTWPGVVRHYRLIPMVPGTFLVPPQQITVTYADPDTNAPVQAVLDVPAIELAGSVPEGAEGLDPFIAATDLTLTQDVSEKTTGLAPGEGVARTVTATIEGASPIVLPPLIPDAAIPGIRAYVDNPRVSESDDRGMLGGMRVEEITLMAESGGEGRAPAITLDWFNIDSGERETVSLDGFPVSVEVPPMQALMARFDWRSAVYAVTAALLAVLAVAFLLRRWSAHRAARRARFEASAAFSWREARRAARAQDYPALIRALDQCASRAPRADPRRDQAIRDALTALGAARYAEGSRYAGQAWSALERALTARPAVMRTDLRAEVLPPLNPGR